MGRELTYPECLAHLTPLVDAVFPSAAVTIKHDEYGLVADWEDGPSIPQIRAVCFPSAGVRMRYARRYNMQSLKHVAVREMRSHGVSTEGLRVGMQSTGAVLRSHRTVRTNAGPIESLVMDEAARTSFSTRPLDGTVLLEQYTSLNEMSVYHPECYAHMLYPLTHEVLSGNVLPTQAGTIQAVALGGVDPTWICDLISCERPIREEAQIR